MTAPFVTSVRVEPSDGPHDYVTVWIRGANVGTLCVGKGDGELLRALLVGDRDCTTGPMAFAKCDRRADVARYDAELAREARETLAGLPPGMTVRDATDAEQLHALAGTIREMRERGNSLMATDGIDAALVREARETIAGYTIVKMAPDGRLSLRDYRGSVHGDRAYLTPTFSPDVAPATIKRCAGCRAIAGDGPCPICGSCSFEEGEP